MQTSEPRNWKKCASCHLETCFPNHTFHGTLEIGWNIISFAGSGQPILRGSFSLNAPLLKLPVVLAPLPVCAPSTDPSGTAFKENPLEVTHSTLCTRDMSKGWRSANQQWNEIKGGRRKIMTRALSQSSPGGAVGWKKICWLQSQNQGKEKMQPYLCYQDASHLSWNAIQVNSTDIY